MTENRNALNSDALRSTPRSKLIDAIHEQKTAAGAPNKRKVVLSEQSAKTLNQQPVPAGLGGGSAGGGADKEPKKLAKVDIPVSLDIHPFSAQGEFTSPQSALDKMLSAKGNTTASTGENDGANSANRLGGALERGSPELRKTPSASSVHGGIAHTPRTGKDDVSFWHGRAKRAETEALTLKHQLLETKAELKAAEDRLRQKDGIIKDQELRIDDLIESRVPQDDMDDIIAENKRLQQELKENEALLAECQKLIEEYAAGGADDSDEPEQFQLS
ncbi:hypothetical protein IW140_005099 [Coemansia sp. RSA 1813]|nr:hypothetical protein EV178_005092 [Coemansia sp. RSA 1646]KAJ1768320.1 hypothetical protein LPJ74_004918 [Coemansia sp. RSA 1843]KAJ2089052.1 hypothetical protein IW138_003764 [Coemansia sp. RSA 986]KAJ2212014.1 hypothetical protein EV179_005000 [Coemansia sp. RSA 487]KAJ2566057.1 hypothetical protein IW140_005099 [Coemansia sp. RSA 1813]